MFLNVKGPNFPSIQNFILLIKLNLNEVYVVCHKEKNQYLRIRLNSAYKYT